MLGDQSLWSWAGSLPSFPVFASFMVGTCKNYNPKINISHVSLTAAAAAAAADDDDDDDDDDDN